MTMTYKRYSSRHLPVVDFLAKRRGCSWLKTQRVCLLKTGSRTTLLSDWRVLVVFIHELFAIYASKLINLSRTANPPNWICAKWQNVTSAGGSQALSWVVFTAVFWVPSTGCYLASLIAFLLVQQPDWFGLSYRIPSRKRIRWKSFVFLTKWL